MTRFLLRIGFKTRRFWKWNKIYRIGFKKTWMVMETLQNVCGFNENINIFSNKISSYRNFNKHIGIIKIWKPFTTKFFCRVSFNKKFLNLFVLATYILGILLRDLYCCSLLYVRLNWNKRSTSLSVYIKSVFFLGTIYNSIKSIIKTK